MCTVKIIAISPFLFFYFVRFRLVNAQMTKRNLRVRAYMLHPTPNTYVLLILLKRNGKTINVNRY